MVGEKLWPTISKTSSSSSAVDQQKTLEWKWYSKKTLVQLPYTTSSEKMEFESKSVGQQHQKQPVARWCQPWASQLPQPLNSRGPITDSVTTLISWPATMWGPAIVMVHVVCPSDCHTRISLTSNEIDLWLLWYGNRNLDFMVQNLLSD